MMTDTGRPRRQEARLASLGLLLIFLAFAVAGAAKGQDNEINATGIVGVPFSYAGAAPGEAGYLLLQGSLPPGLSMSSSTGAVTGTPTTAGYFTYLVAVELNNGNIANVFQTIAITGPTTWNNGGGDSSWSNASNWSSGVPTTSIDVDIGTQPTNNVISLNTNMATTIADLTFESSLTGSAEITNANGETLQVNGAITNQSAFNQTFALPVEAGGSATYAGGTGGLTFSSSLAVGTSAIATSGTVVIAPGATLNLTINSATAGGYGTIGAINASGAVIDISGSYMGDAGDSFQLTSGNFMGASLSGLPTLSAGLSWNTSNFFTNGTLSVESAQSIYFPSLPNQQYPGPTITLNAVASSGLQATYTVLSGPATVSGNILTLNGTGTVTLQASQGGNSEYLPATNFSQSFTVAAAGTGLATSTTNGQVTITGYSGSGGAVVIPSTINGLPVTSIGYSAFYQRFNVTGVTIPDSVTSIAGFAFCEATSLTNVTIPNSVTSIGEFAFSGCENLTSVTLSNNVTNIPEYTFSDCPRLTVMALPYGVTSIAEYAFQDCTALTSLTLPNSVTSLGEYSFQGCTSLPGVVIPSSVTSIVGYAFDGCSSLTSAVFEGNAPAMGGSVFAGCANGFKVYYYAGATGGFAAPTWTDSSGDQYSAVNSGSNSDTPTIISGGTASSPYGAPFTYAIVALGSPNIFSATGLPHGLSIDPSTGVISGAPIQLGTFNIVLSATDTTTSQTGTLNLTLTVGQNSQTITFPGVGSPQYPGPVVLLAATASSGLPVTYTIVSGPATVVGYTLTPTGVGSVTIQASQGGDDGYLAATSVTQTFSITLPDQTISAFSIPDQPYGEAPFTLTPPTATSGLPVTLFVSSGPLGLSGNTITVAGCAYCGITAVQAGNADFSPAPYVTATFDTYYPYYTFMTLAGMAGSAGSGNGAPLTAARFSQPQGVAVDRSGNIFVADTGNNLIREISSAGVVSTLASTATFKSPTGVAVDGYDNVYVADTGNDLIREISSTGVVKTLAGTAGMAGSTNGSTSIALFNRPSAVAVDIGGNVYVADSGNNTIRKITPAGMVSTLAGSAGTPPGSANGTGTAALFDNPSGVAVDFSGNVYVADTGNDMIREITPFGLVTSVAGTAGASGSKEGAPSVALFSSPTGVAVDGSGNVYVTDTGNDTFRKIFANGLVTTPAGTPGTPGSADGDGNATLFHSPSGLAVDGNGNIYVADTVNDTIREGLPDTTLRTLSTMNTCTGQRVALTTSIGESTVSFFKYAIESGLATVSGVDSNIVTITGTGPIVAESLFYTGGTSGQGLNGDAPIEVTQPLPASGAASVGAMAVSGPTSATVGVAIPLTITPQDGQGNTIVGSSDMFEFTSSDPAAVLPATGTLPSASTVGVTFNTPGNQTITVTDTSVSPEVVTTYSMMVNSPNGAAITSAASATLVIGSTNSFTIAASGHPTPAIMENTALPTGVSFADNHNGTATLSVASPTTTTGTYVLSLAATNGVGAVATQTFNLTVQTAYTQWADQKFTASELHDTTDPSFPLSGSIPFHDGVSNLLKYVFDIDPSVPMTAGVRAAAMPVVGVDMTNPNQFYLTLTYRENSSLASDPTVTVNVQTSTDLQNWATATPAKTQSSTLSDGDVMIEDEVEMNGTSPEFIRLNVTGP